MINKGLINIKNTSSSIIKPTAGVFNPGASHSTRRNSKSGIWSIQDVYEQQKSKTWTLKDKKAKVKTQILASSPVYNSVSAEKCASTVKLYEDVFCLVYASSDTVINYELFSVEIGLSLTDKSGLITSEELGSITTLTEGAARVSEISSSFDETSNRILLCITYGYGTGGGISGGSQTMTSKSAVKIVIGKYNNALRSVSWTVVDNLYDLTISTTPYNTDPVPTTTPIQTPIVTFYDTPVTTFYQTLNTLTQGTTPITTTIFSGFRQTSVISITTTPAFSGTRQTYYPTIIQTTQFQRYTDGLTNAGTAIFSGLVYTNPTTIVNTVYFSGTRLTQGTTGNATAIFSGTRQTPRLTVAQTQGVQTLNTITQYSTGPVLTNIVSGTRQTTYQTTFPVRNTLRSTSNVTQISTFPITQYSTFNPTLVATQITTFIATQNDTSILTNVVATQNITTQNDTVYQTFISTGPVLTQNPTIIYTLAVTQNVLTTVFFDTQTQTFYNTQNDTFYFTYLFTPQTTQNDTFITTLALTQNITTQGLTPVGTIGQTPVATIGTTSLATTIPGDPVVNNAPPSQIYSVCETERIGENTFIISTHGYVRVITLTSDTTYSAGTQTASSIVPAGGSTELLKTAWDSISSEYVELAWDILNSLGKISRYTVSGTTVTAQDTTTLTSTQMSSSIGNIINIGERKYIWNDYEEVYQITHNGTSFSVSASPLNLGTIGTSNFNTTLIKDNNVPGFVMGYFSNETTSSYNKIVNYLYDNSTTGGIESNSFSLLDAEFSNNTAINYVDLVTFEDNVVLLIYEYSSILYANILQLKSY